MAAMSDSTLKQRVYQGVRDMILAGKIRPGEPLRERDLAQQLNVSRTPLREALNRLERDGLAVATPHKGYHVPALDPKMAAELLELRYVLDGHAAGLAARNITEKGIRELESVMAELDHLAKRKDPSTEDLAEEIRVGLQIHYIIAREAGQRFLNEVLSNMYGRLSLYIWVEVLWVDRWDLTRAEHREIIDAVVARDETRATKAAQDHVRRSIDEMDRVTQALSILQSRAVSLLI